MNPAVKKLAARFREKPGLLAKVKAALAAGEPLWTIGVYDDEAAVKETIRLMEAK